MAFNLSRQKIVRRAGAAHGCSGVALGLYARTREPKHRADNASLLHRGEPQLAKIGQPRQRVFPPCLRQIDGRWIPVLNEIGMEEMFLKSDLFDHASSSATRGTQANSALCTS